MRTHKQNPAGFSLIEVVFAMALISFILFGVIKLETSTVALGNTQNNQLRAYFWANQAITVLENLGPAASPCPGSSCTAYLHQSGTTYTLDTSPEAAIDGLFTRSILIRPVTPSSPPAYQATAVVEWQDSTGDHNQTNGAAVTAKSVIY